YLQPRQLQRLLSRKLRRKRRLRLRRLLLLLHCLLSQNGLAFAVPIATVLFTACNSKPIGQPRHLFKYGGEPTRPARPGSQYSVTSYTRRSSAVGTRLSLRTKSARVSRLGGIAIRPDSMSPTAAPVHVGHPLSLTAVSTLSARLEF